MRGYPICTSGRFSMVIVYLIADNDQGIEGTLIRYEEGYDPLDENQRIRGVQWNVDPSLGEYHTTLLRNKLTLSDLDPSLLSLVERLVPLASNFTAVEAYMELR
jgi:gamma-tubulin complex component 2